MSVAGKLPNLMVRFTLGPSSVFHDSVITLGLSSWLMEPNWIGATAAIVVRKPRLNDPSHLLVYIPESAGGACGSCTDALRAPLLAGDDDVDPFLEGLVLLLVKDWLTYWHFKWQHVIRKRIRFFGHGRCKRRLLSRRLCWIGSRSVYWCTSIRCWSCVLLSVMLSGRSSIRGRLACVGLLLLLCLCWWAILNLWASLCSRCVIEHCSGSWLAVVGLVCIWSSIH